MHVLRLSYELVLNRAPAGATNWEFLSANYDSLMGRTMTAGVLYEINPARGRELTRTADYLLGKIGSHKTSICKTSHRSRRNQGEPSARGNFQASSCVLPSHHNYHERCITVMLVCSADYICAYRYRAYFLNCRTTSSRKFSRSLF